MIFRFVFVQSLNPSNDVLDAAGSAEDVLDVDGVQLLCQVDRAEQGRNDAHAAAQEPGGQHRAVEVDVAVHQQLKIIIGKTLINIESKKTGVFEQFRTKFILLKSKRHTKLGGYTWVGQKW